jgi:hypothetical protein
MTSGFLFIDIWVVTFIFGVIMKKKVSLKAMFLLISLGLVGTVAHAEMLPAPKHPDVYNQLTISPENHADAAEQHKLSSEYHNALSQHHASLAREHNKLGHEKLAMHHENLSRLSKEFAQEYSALSNSHEEHANKK